MVTWFVYWWRDGMINCQKSEHQFQSNILSKLNKMIYPDIIDNQATSLEITIHHWPKLSAKQLRNYLRFTRGMLGDGTESDGTEFFKHVQNEWGFNFFSQFIIFYSNWGIGVDLTSVATRKKFYRVFLKLIAS